MFYINNLVLTYRFLAYSQGPGGFRELREAYRNHFHRSWYLSDAVVTSYSQKPSWREFFDTVYGISGFFTVSFWICKTWRGTPSRHLVGQHVIASKGTFNHEVVIYEFGKQLLLIWMEDSRPLGNWPSGRCIGLNPMLWSKMLKCIHLDPRT